MFTSRARLIASRLLFASARLLHAIAPVTTWLQDRRRANETCPPIRVPCLSRLQYRSVAISALLVLSCGVILFLMFKRAQLDVAHPRLHAHYPGACYLPAAFTGGLFALNMWLGIAFLVRVLTGPAQMLSVLRGTARSFLVVFLFPLFLHLPRLTWAPTLLQRHPVQLLTLSFLVAVILCNWRSLCLRRLVRNRHAILVLLIIVTVLGTTAPSISPFFPDHIPGKFTDELDGIHGLGQRLLTDAGAYSSTWLDTESAFGALPAPIWCNFSYFLGPMSLVLGTSPLDVMGRIRLYKLLYFALAVAGSWFFYFFLRRSLRLRFFPALYGAVLYMPGNQVLWKQLEAYSVGFWSNYFVLPLALLLITEGARRKDYRLASLAGFIYAAATYACFPHADNFMICLRWMLGPFLLFTSFFCTTWRKLQGLANCLGFLFGLAAGFSLFVFPHVQAARLGEQCLAGYTNAKGVLWSSENAIPALFQILLFGAKVDYVDKYAFKWANIPGQHDHHYILTSSFLIVLVLVFYASILRVQRSLFHWGRESLAVFNPSSLATPRAFWACAVPLYYYVAICGDRSLVHYIFIWTNAGYVRALYRFAPLCHIAILIVAACGLNSLGSLRLRGIRIPAFVGTACLALASILYFSCIRDISPVIISGGAYALGILPLLVMLARPSLVTKSLALAGAVLAFLVGNAPESQGTDPLDRFVSMQAVMFNYPAVSHDPRAASYVRDRVNEIRHNITYTQVTAAKSEDLQAASEALLRAGQETAVPLNTDSMASLAPRMDKVMLARVTQNALPVRLPCVKAFNAVPASEDHVDDHLWHVFPPWQKPVSTPPRLGWVKWFGGHGAVRPANRSDLFNQVTEWANTDYQWDDFFWLRLAVSGVGYALAPAEFSPILAACGLYELEVVPDSPTMFKVWRVPQSFGRAYFALKVDRIAALNLERISQTADPAAFAFAQDAAADNLRKVTEFRQALVENLPAESFVKASASTDSATIRDARYVANKCAFDVSVANAAAFFVLNHTLLSDWVAYVDSTPARIYPTNIAFMGIVVPPGEHLLWFEYRPVAKLVGLWTVLAGALILLSWPILRYFPLTAQDGKSCMPA